MTRFSQEANPRVLRPKTKLRFHLPKYIIAFILEPLMSRHPSFKPPGGLSKKRNVLKRFERVELLRKRGQWKEGDRVVSLVKTKPEE